MSDGDTLFAYLEEVEADGCVRYVTEGMLRALHRKEAPCPPEHRTSWPFRSFARADAAPLRPGQSETIRFALLPTAWRFANESASRVPLTDWYDTVTGKQQGFQARSVVGGLFIKMLADPAMWKKYSTR